MLYRVKHRIPTMVVRMLLGLFLVLSGGGMLFLNATTGLTGLQSLEGIQGDFLRAVVALGYLFPFIGLFKFVTGILVLIPRTAPLGVLAAFPYAVNIVLWSTVPDTMFAPLGIPVCLASIYLVYAYFDYYRPIVAPIFAGSEPTPSTSDPLPQS